jgi:ATP-dependent exoDNAse (exonuclease V) beta subunit
VPPVTSPALLNNDKPSDNRTTEVASACASSSRECGGQIAAWLREGIRDVAAIDHWFRGRRPNAPACLPWRISMAEC